MRGGHRIHRYNPINNSFESLEPNLKGAMISTLAFGTRFGRFWIGTNPSRAFSKDPINGQIEQFIEEKKVQKSIFSVFNPVRTLFGRYKSMHGFTTALLRMDCCSLTNNHEI